MGDANQDIFALCSQLAPGGVERGTAQDRLVKGLRVAGANTLEEDNTYLQKEFLPWCR
jgi:hypothetical protein